MMNEKLCSYPILRYFDVIRPALLYIDASNYSVGAVLGQINEQGREYVCEYFGRALRKHEKNYSVSEKELLLVVESATRFEFIWRLKNLRLLQIIEP